MTILIFGAAVRPDGKPSVTLKRRVAAALVCAKGHNEVKFIPTGAIGRYGPSEASVMADLLRESGVGSDAILLEETGTDTLSSVLAIVRLLRENPPRGPVMVATSAYHLPRCLILLRLLNVPAKPCAPTRERAGAFRWKRWYWRLREVPALPYDAMLALLLRLSGRF
jgi:vancomycin permeability regulator SanA